MYDIDADEKVEKTSKKIVDNLNAMAYKGKQKTKDYLKDGKGVVGIKVGEVDENIGKNLAAYVNKTDKAIKASARRANANTD